MRKVILMAISLFAIGCQNEQPIDPKVENSTSIEVVNQIDEAEALSIASTFWEGKDYSNMKAEELYASAGSRSTQDQPVAYVVNSTDTPGFVIVKNDSENPTVLAYSNENGFNANIDSEHPVFSAFINRISNMPQDIGIAPPAPMSYVVPELLNIESWHQNLPYSKFVVKDHPRCAVGCIPLAYAKAMIYSKDICYSITDGNSTGDVQSVYNLSEIRNALIDYNKYKYSYSNPNYNSIVKRYEVAMDSLSSMLYAIGIMTHTTYGRDSSTRMVDARIMLDKMGFKTNPRSVYYSKEIDPYEMLLSLMNSNILIMSGMGDEEHGHCWIVDGASYTLNYDYDPEDATTGDPYANIKLYCDWGWDGDCNGYFCGQVFEPTDYDSDYNPVVLTSYKQLEYVEVIKQN